MRPIIPQTFTGFGIILKRLKREDLPLLMTRHNHQDILHHMKDTRPVSLAILEFWLKKIETYEFTFPFVAICGNEQIGYIDLQHCDFNKGICEDGIFLYKNSQYGRGYGSRILLCREKLLMALNIVDVISRVKAENERSIRFFQKMGGKYIKTENGFLIFKEAFQDRIHALKKTATQLGFQKEFIKTFGGNDGQLQKSWMSNTPKN